MTSRLAACYEAASKWAGGCAIEAGLLIPLADHECRHGRLPNDGSEPCGCWPIAPQPRRVTAAERERQAHERYRLVERLWAEGLTHQQIADRLGCSLGQANGYVAAARARGYQLPRRPRGRPPMREAA